MISLETNISSKNSIVTRMLIVVLGLYLLIAIGGTLSHFWFEYKYQKNSIIQDLGDIESAFANGLAVSLWMLDEKSLNASVDGMLKIPSLVGVKIISNGGTTVAIGGIVTEQGETGNVGFHVNLAGLSNEETVVHSDGRYNMEMFDRQFQIKYDLDGKSRLLGHATLYSNSSVIYRRMKLQGVMIAANVLLALFTFSIALLWAVNHYLRRPLASLASATEKVSLENLDSFQVRVGVSGHNEITVLEKSFNQMIGNLHVSMVKREKAEKAIKIFRSAVAASSDAIRMLTSDGDNYYQNAAFDRMFGKIGAAPSPALYVEKSVGREMFQSIMAGDKWLGEVQMHGVDGNILDIFLRAYALQDRGGKIVNLVVVHTDITEMKLAEKNLAAEKERLAVTLRSIGDGVVTTDISGNITMLNKVAERLTGFKNDDAAGRPLEEVFHMVHEHTRELCENSVTKVINTGQVVGLAKNTILVARGGTERRIADSAAPILDAESNTIGVVLVFRDVTEQVKTEKELLKIKKLESVGILAGGIAHDFNNILAAILGNINLALFDDSLRSSTRSILSEAEKASLRARDLTQQLLTFSKGGEPIKKSVSLESVIKDSANFVLHGGKVACHYNIPENLWLADIDRGQIGQVIQNIVINASHAMPSGGVVKVTCENVSSDDKSEVPALPEGQFVKISIQDDGIGMPAEIVEKIFDPYFSTKNEGSGLGLAITNSIMIKHGGQISVESSPGTGTTFFLYLPALEDEKVKSQDPEVLLCSSFKAKILIMDDEEIVRNVIRAMLNQLGHEVVLAADGATAVKLYQEALGTDETFDLVIMDLTVPGGMGGEDAVQEVLKIDPNAKVIVSSGYSNDPIMANYSNFGFCSAIVKPHQLQELSKVISQVLE